MKNTNKIDEIKFKDEIINYVDKVLRRCEYIDLIDFYYICHYYTILYGVKYNDNFIEDMKSMWDKLKEYYEYNRVQREIE